MVLLVAVAVVCWMACESITTETGTGNNPDCQDCITIGEIIEDYQANSIRAERLHVGKRYNIAGKIESITEDWAVPPRPLVRVKSGGKRGSLTFSWDGDHEWLLEYSKGDYILANCRVTGLLTLAIGVERGTPDLEECTQRR